MERMTLEQIATACGGVLSTAAAGERFAKDIKIDSRRVEPGDLFVAVKGERFDGHDFLAQAFGKGAVGAVVSRKTDFSPVIRVESTLDALQDIAAYYRGAMRAKVVAVTGSVGKTTAKEMIASVLSQKLDVQKTSGNFNNDFGLPQTIFRIDAHHEAAVVEMGMSGPGEIRRLGRIAQPDAAVIMNIGESHIGSLGSREAILAAKSEIFEYLQPGGQIFLCGDDDMLATLVELQPVYFGRQPHNDVKLVEILRADMCGTQIAADVFGERMEFSINQPGEYLIYPALAAAAVGSRMGLSAAEIAAGIAEFEPTGMRMRRIETSRLVIINDVYNACKQSILAGAQTLRFAKGRKVAIVGDILELGEFGPAIHRETGAALGSMEIDVIICVGEMAAYMAKGAKQTSSGVVLHFDTQQALFTQLGGLIEDGDTVFVKASRGMRFEYIVEALEALE